MVSRSVIDAQLTTLGDGDRIYLCTTAPSNYSEAVSFSLVLSNSVTWYAISDYDLGRQRSVAGFADGVVSGAGSCTHVAIVNVSESALVATQALRDSLIVSVGQIVSLTDIVFRVPYLETFEEADRPVYSDLVVPGVSDEGWIAEPWNYDDPGNLLREYPLVIYFNAGSGTTISDVFNQLPDGFGLNDGQYKIGDYGKEYPAMYWLARPATGYDNARAVIDVDRLDWIKANYRIDTDRIYLCGYSAGGQACHYLVDANYTENGHEIAAIIRLSGGYKPDIADPDLSEWLHQGLADQQYRIDNMRLIYSNYKTNRPGGAESKYTKTIVYSGEHDQYDINDEPSCILSEYDGIDHFYILDVWGSDDLMTWLFDRRK